MMLESETLLNEKNYIKSNARRKFYGIFLALLAGAFQTMRSSVFKSQSVEPGDVIIVRGLLQFTITTIWGICNRHQFLYCHTSAKIQFLLIINAIPCGLMPAFYFNAVKLLPLGDSMVYIFSAPLFSSKYNNSHSRTTKAQHRNNS